MAEDARKRQSTARRSPLPGLVLGASLLLAACSVDRSGLGPHPWDQSVAPANVCPGDFVTVSWNTREHRAGCLRSCGLFGCSECPDPMQVSLSSTPPVVPGFSTFEQSSSFSAGPIVVDTDFLFELRDNDEDLGDWEQTVHVVLPERESVAFGVLEGTCSGTVAGWAPLDLRGGGPFRSELVRLVQVCNYNGFAVQLRLAFETGTESTTLLPGECTREFEAAVGAKAVNAQARPLDPSLLASADCSPTRSLPPDDFDLAFYLACGLESASEAVVAGTPEPTPIPLPAILDTPTPTEPPRATARIRQNTNCRTGPGTVYDIMAILQPSQEVTVEGQNDFEPKWWRVSLDEGGPCWLSDSVVEVVGPAAGLPHLPAPPTPTATPAVGCLYQFPNDTQLQCYVPCPIAIGQSWGACVQ